LFLNLDDLKTLNINAKKIKTIQNEFKSFIEKLDKSTKESISIFNVNFSIFQVKENGIFIENDWNKDILKNVIENIKKNFINKFSYDTKELKALIQNTHAQKNSPFDFFVVTFPINKKMSVLKIKNDIIEIEYQFKRLKIKEIIIIENKECFFRYEEFLNKNYFENLPNLNDCLIIYGEGNAISNKKLENFFLQYETIHCFLDYDQGGFQIFKNLKHHNKILHLPKKEIMKNIIELIYYHQQYNFKKVITTTIEEKFFKNYYYDITKDLDIIKNKKEIIQIEQEIFLLKGLENGKNFK